MREGKRERERRRGRWGTHVQRESIQVFMEV